MKIALDGDNGMDLVTIDADLEEVIRSVFGDMNQIEYHLEKIKYEDGSLKNKTVTTYETVFYITITSRTAEEQAAEYSFANDQN
ncbi:hypothetical protein [Paenibacillus sp. FSL H7-689]|uniref:hypothetical protein n=1 Tax=Paenibacillus sp. FSL H7-689 TaxID=1227349 RepID=UPI0003E1FD82|nr:hypothetical protein [Paenibacillus sp. FSL H7-689]ETT51580.1 hypothetical protein C170_14345 [Paenibacillus sp. FSL H7-689]